MSVQDIRFKLILCLCMIFPPLLLSYSHAFPDLTFYNNFLTGASPFYYDGSDTYFYPNDGTNSRYNAFVTSFSNTYMHGTEIPSAVPYLDLDYTVGKVWGLPSNSLIVVGTTSGDHQFLSHNAVTGGNLHYIILGTSLPHGVYSSGLGYHTNVMYDSAGEAYSDYSLCGANGNLAGLNTYLNNLDDFFLYSNISNSQTWINLTQGTSQVDGQYNSSYYILLYNSSPNTIKFTVEPPSYLNNHNISYDAPYMSADNFSGICSFYSYDSAINGKYGVYSFLPHINGNIDVYQIPNNFYTMSEMSSSSSYRFGVYFNLSMEMYETVEGYLVVGIKNSTGTTTRDYSRVNYNFLLTQHNPDSSYMPLFLNYNSLYGLYNRAIWIKDGYIAINNYDELIEKLENSGFTGDLARVIALLEEINTGGESGQATKQLMDILEQYHGVLVQQGDNDWATINQQYNAFKYLLDFSGDTIHWIVTANNALFNYFSGFIILCAFFLVLDRIMRG